jgi:hypothetical protein
MVSVGANDEPDRHGCAITAHAANVDGIADGESRGRTIHFQSGQQRR